MDCSLPGSSVHGMLQARILEWVGVSSSGGCSRLRDRTCVSSASCISDQFFTTEPPGKPKVMCRHSILTFRVTQMLCVCVGEKPPDVRHELLTGCWNVFTGSANTGWPLIFFSFPCLYYPWGDTQVCDIKTLSSVWWLILCVDFAAYN